MNIARSYTERDTSWYLSVCPSVCLSVTYGHYIQTSYPIHK